MFSLASFALSLANASCLLGHYTHALWDMVGEILSTVSEDLQPLLPQTIQDDLDVARFVIRSDLDTIDSPGGAMGTSVVLWRTTHG